ncbi:ABC transporter substrate-binding protein [Arthrobacter mobilis]|uniref:Extracellular solute-binding protein n=1 Tax=Arthrobacter mobilis TaxID=2724944 RepID=A0A7X6HGU2_9MICC|nr:extracellular solute-binding protein [Arthrobacter mobilis]NKX55776.1 extracellular solute-binding protein [Arthrobacter mobilis]
MSRSGARAAAGGRKTRTAAAVLATAAGLALTACAPGGSAPAATPRAAVSTEIGTEQIELSLYNSQGSKAKTEALIKGFEAEHPNIDITARYDPDNVVSQNLPRLLSSPDSPDLALSTGAVVDNVRKGLLVNLEPYAEAYGWDALPSSQLASARVSAEGIQGQGSLYAMPDGFTLTGMFYNKQLAAKLGMDKPPASVAELEALLAKAKDAGITPIMTAGQLGLGTTAYQDLLNNELGPQKVNEWIYRVPGSTIDNADGVRAAQTLKKWVDAGYFNDDANGTSQDASYSRFADGEALFMFQGNWAVPILAPGMKDNLGFALFPPVEEGGPVAAMSGPASPFAISAQSEHPDAAAAFLDWLRSDEARRIAVDNGLAPVGTADQELPPVKAGTVEEAVQQGFRQLSADNGLVDFVQNATAGIQVNAWNPESQRLFGGQASPQEFVTAVQRVYESELGK